MKYDIFISYRRDGGAQYARILQLMLIQRGYKVFLDYDELTDGIFCEKIKNAIKDAPVFIIVLSKGSMERCVNEDDWVRKEMTLAIEEGKHIIPIDPDCSFDGFPDAMPLLLKDAVGSLQYTEMNFGQTLGVTIDLLIKNRLEPTLGARMPQKQKAEDFAAAQGIIYRKDFWNKFLRRFLAFSVAVLIVIVSGFYFLHNKELKEKEALTEMRNYLHKKYEGFMLQLNRNLTMTQLNVIDELLMNMSEVYPDSVWISQFEFTVGQWYGIKGEAFDEAGKNLPMTGVSFEDVFPFLFELGDMTNLMVELPGVDVWEYAARSGEARDTFMYAGNDDVDKVAWYEGNSGGRLHPSDGQQGKDPNGLDLYDMSGNVSELCNTPFGSSGLYSICGGNYRSSASDVMLVSRNGFALDAKSDTVGFRIIIRRL